jgi:hypothetical protein
MGVQYFDPDVFGAVAKGLPGCGGYFKMLFEKLPQEGLGFGNDEVASVCGFNELFNDFF